MIVFAHPDNRLHDPSAQHWFGGELLPPAETAERSERVLSGLEAAGGFDIREPSPVERADLLRVHTHRYLEFLENAHERWRTLTRGAVDAEAVAFIRPIPGTPWREPMGILAQMGRFSNDVDPILSGTWEAALSAVSCAVAAADAVLAGEPAAYALSRPPGHHAAAETYGGYCFLNNVAIAAGRLASKGARVGIIDVDTHHGNGTQSIFWRSREVLTVSIHGDPDENFPFFLGYSDEAGEGEGTGSNLNIPLPTGSDWAVYEGALTSALAKVGAHAVDALIVSLGVDTQVAHGVLALEGDDYTKMGEAFASAGLPTVFVQEGGYEPGVLERDVPAVLLGFRSAANRAGPDTK